MSNDKKDCLFALQGRVFTVPAPAVSLEAFAWLELTFVHPEQPSELFKNRTTQPIQRVVFKADSLWFEGPYYNSKNGIKRRAAQFFSTKELDKKKLDNNE